MTCCLRSRKAYIPKKKLGSDSSRKYYKYGKDAPASVQIPRTSAPEHWPIFSANARRLIPRCRDICQVEWAKMIGVRTYVIPCVSESAKCWHGLPDLVEETQSYGQCVQDEGEQRQEYLQGTIRKPPGKDLHLIITYSIGGHDNLKSWRVSRDASTKSLVAYLNVLGRFKSV